MRRRLAGVVLLAAGATLLAGCVDLPESGPVIDADVTEERDGDQASSIDARPPQPGDSRLEVVNGFLESMMAWPISTSTAKLYLTDDAAEEWDPEETLIYSDLAAPREDGSTVSIRMRNAALLDESGGWRDTIPADRSELRFRLTIEDGEFRILDPMDALIVRTSWFQQRFRQASLYYFDPTAQVLVPEPVFVPIGESFATYLVTALLAGPPDRLRDVVTSFVPDGLSVGLSVPVIEGVATVDLHGDAPRTSPESELMLAQLAATLRQEPGISAIRVSIGGQVIDPPGAGTAYPVGATDAFDPADTGSEGVLYGLRGGRLVVGGFGELRPVDGPFGRVAQQVSSIAVSPGGNQVAAVSEDRRQVVVGPLRAPEDGTGIEVLVNDGTDLSRPTWDASERLWLLDATPDGARLLVADGDDGAREVDVPGVTGSLARRILVSRDGTRLVALVTGPDGDELVAARVVLDGRGRVDRGVGAAVIWSSTGPRAIDLAWTGEAEIALLTPARPGELFEVETVAADGATVGVDTLATMVAGPIRGLAGEPFADSPIYAVSEDALIDIRTGEPLPTARTRELDYAG